MKQAQAAMEFLMTYGWAILVVLIAIGALAYFGVLSPEQFLPEKCLISTGSGLFCEQFSASSGIIRMRIKNILDDQIQITEASVSQEGYSCSLASPVTIPADSFSDITLSSGATCVNLTLPGAKLKGDLSVKFIKNSFQKTTSGSVTVKIGETIMGGVSQPICDNAQTYGLCDGLDIIFGAGYKDDCCTSYGLCC